MRGFLDPRGKFYEIGEERHHEWSDRVHGISEGALIDRGWLRIVVGWNEPIFTLKRFDLQSSKQWEWLETFLWEHKSMRLDMQYTQHVKDVYGIYEWEGDIMEHVSIEVKLDELRDESLEDHLKRELRFRILQSRPNKNCRVLLSGHGGTLCELSGNR
jgi:hypothetical protein